MKAKHYLIVQNEVEVACCDDNTMKEQLEYYTGSHVFELEENEKCPICSEEEE